MCAKIINKEQKKTDIAAAALIVFAENGFDTTTISQVANQAGISKGSIYLYYNSKEELVIAAISNWVATMAKNIELLINPQLSAIEQLKQLFAASTQTFLENPNIIGLFLGISQISLRNPHLFDKYNVQIDVSAPIRSAICKILQLGIDQGSIRPEITTQKEQIARNLVAFVDGLGLHYIIDRQAFTINQQIDLYLQGLFNSIARKDNQ